MNTSSLHYAEIPEILISPSANVIHTLKNKALKEDICTTNETVTYTCKENMTPNQGIQGRHSSGSTTSTATKVLDTATMRRKNQPNYVLACCAWYSSMNSTNGTKDKNQMPAKGFRVYTASVLYIKESHHEMCVADTVLE